jgi:sulfotransferase family protein
MKMPNFLIIGAMKSGTTALYYYLEQHPQIYMSPVKEPNFFCLEGQETPDFKSISDSETYRGLFKGATDERALGEASHCYLYEAKAIERIKFHVPEAKLIAILRNPIDRAYSHFLHMVRNGTEPITDFAQALQADRSGTHQKRAPQDYIGRGFYYIQLKRYFDNFPRDQIRIYLYDDLNRAPIDTLQDTFRFLGVDDSFVPDITVKRNVSGYPKSQALDKLLRLGPVTHALKLYLPADLRWRLSKIHDMLKSRNLFKPPPVQLTVRRQLIETYREDILNLQELIRRDLSEWLV